MGGTGPEGSDVVVAGQCLGGETSLRAPSLIVDHNIPGIWLSPPSTRAHIMSRADIQLSGVNRSRNSRTYRRGHFRPSVKIARKKTRQAKLSKRKQML